MKRYTASPSAREYVRQYATPTGRITDPMLTIHTTSDALVLGNDVTAYEVPAAARGNLGSLRRAFRGGRRPLQLHARAVGTAFDALLAWARDGKRPAAGEQK